MQNTTLSPKSSGNEASWQDRLAHIVHTMREMSRQSDPQKMVQTYGTRMRELMPLDRFVAISRRNVDPPFYKITRSTAWKESIDPWKSPHLLPTMQGGLLGKLLYAEEPAIINDLQLDADDPGAPHLAGMRSAIVIPHFDGGKVLNMVLLMRKEPNAFVPEELPEQVLTSNLFGRATQSLVLSRQVKEAYDALDKEMQVVADIQRSLLPESLPSIPTLDLSVYYQTSRRAGGDYYDFFPISGSNGEPAGSPGGRWGILIADVSGHGTPAAVLMAVTHSIAHSCCSEPTSPGELLRFVNQHLCARYTSTNGTFVTAFYGIYDPAQRKLHYASAGHCPPRLRRNGRPIASLEEARYLPLGIEAAEAYDDGVETFEPGDVLVLYTDGITEARNASNELLGISRLDETIASVDGSAADYVAAAISAVTEFEAGKAATDDKTLLVAKVS